jgi:hypothetical protein
MKGKGALAVLAVAAIHAAPTLRADVVINDFEGGTTPGWGWLTGDARGVVAWDPSLGPANGTVVAAPSGPLAGSNVLKMTGTPAFNYGQSGGAVLGFDMLSQNLRSAFLEHDQLEFDWYAPPDPNSTSGWSQIWNVILNTQGGGFGNVDGYSQNNPNANPPVDKSQFNQFYFTGFNGSLKHIVVDYSAYKNLILGSANPDGGGWIQLGMQLNPGGGAPAEMWFDNFKFSIASEIWNVDADGTWSTDGNWSRGAHPNAPGKVATFGPAILAPRTVTVDAAKTVGHINFNNANKYTIAGSEALTLDSTSAVGITVSNGSHDVTAPLALAKDVNIAVGAADSTLTLSNLQASPVGVTKSGAGVLAVNNVRANSLTVNGGSVVIAQDGTAAGTSNVSSVSIDSGAKLDLKDNKLVTNTAPGTATGGVYDGLQREVQRARAGNAWNTPGLTTSMADAKVGKTTIGVSTGKQIRNLGPTQTSLWGGETITATSTLAMYTYAGDANLDGQIDAGDYGIIDNFVQVANASGYGNGDFNYDGFIDAGDYGIIDNNIQAQGTPFPVGGAVDSASLPGVTAVPEPGTATLAIAAAAALLRRRRRAI